MDFFLCMTYTLGLVGAEGVEEGECKVIRTGFDDDQ